MMMALSGSVDQIVQALRAQVARAGAGEQVHERPRISSGCQQLDRLLPGHGFARGMLIEWLQWQPGSGAGTLALLAARQASQQPGQLVRAIVVMDRAGTFYPPAAAAWGIELGQLVLVRARSVEDELWALDQALRSPAVAAVWACVDRLDDRTFRRLRLASEESGALGLLIRPAAIQTRPTWSDLQLLVRPVAEGPRPEGTRAAACSPIQAPDPRWRLQVQLVRSRERGSGLEKVEFLLEQTASAWVSSDESSRQSYSGYLAAQLARPAVARRAAGA